MKVRQKRQTKIMYIFFLAEKLIGLNVCILGAELKSFNPEIPEIKLLWFWFISNKIIYHYNHA